MLVVLKMRPSLNIDPPGQSRQFCHRHLILKSNTPNHPHHTHAPARQPFCFLCFPDDPIPGYARGDNPNSFQVPLKKACLADPCCCIASVACPFPVACYNRYLVRGCWFVGCAGRS